MFMALLARAGISSSSLAQAFACACCFLAHLRVLLS